MKIGLSLYSIDREIREGRMTLESAIDWSAAHGAECIEFAPFAYSFEHEDGTVNYGKIKTVKRIAADARVLLVNYSILADFCTEDTDIFEAEIKRVQKHVRIAAELGMPRMRHDIAAFRRSREELSTASFERLFPRMVEAASRVSEYAQTLGVMTMLENHGFFVNGCDRCERLIYAVNQDNYRMLLDTGNIVCVDEDPVVAAWKLAPLAEMIHLKDFYIRHRDPGDTTEFDCGGHWFRSHMGKYLRGAITGQGDLNIYEIIGHIKHAGFTGPIVIEFEGFEDPQYASKVSMDNARRIWDEIL